MQRTSVITDPSASDLKMDEKCLSQDKVTVKNGWGCWQY